MSQDDTVVPFGGDDDRESPPGYTILGVHAEDEFAVEYLARQLRLGRTVFLRVAKQHHGQFGWGSLENEAACLARLAHPHVTRLLDRFEHDGRLYPQDPYPERGHFPGRTPQGPGQESRSLKRQGATHLGDAQQGTPAAGASPPG